MRHKSESRIVSAAIGFQASLFDHSTYQINFSVDDGLFNEVPLSNSRTSILWGHKNFLIGSMARAGSQLPHINISTAAKWLSGHV